YHKPAKITAFLNVVDIAGLVKGAHNGQDVWGLDTHIAKIDCRGETQVAGSGKVNRTQSALPKISTPARVLFFYCRPRCNVCMDHQENNEGFSDCRKDTH
ncbi:hypothetical protein U0070_002518, partial [Myodes glareolus]